jgi:predicted O-linked N-acetylglucosamine transferase (SPINDLY family)
MTPITVDQALRLALDHLNAGRWAEAETLLRQVLGQRPDHPDALHLLGVLACQTGHTDAAIELISRAVAISPGAAEYLCNLGEAYRRSGQPDAAIATLRRAVALRPGLAATHHNLGIALYEAGRTEEAVTAFERARQLRPDAAEAENNLGGALERVGRLDEAVAAFERALQLEPQRAEVHSNLGHALNDLGRFGEAIAACERAIALRPDLAEAHNNRGNALAGIGRTDEAIAAYRQAIAQRLALADPYNNLGVVFREQGRLDEALMCFRKAVEVKPDFTAAASNVLFTLHYHPDFDAQAILKEHRDWARRHAEPLAAEIRPHGNDRAPGRRLRVAFVSPDFHTHPVGRLLLALFSHLDRAQIELVAYSDVRLADEVTGRLEALTDQWHDTIGLSDRQLAERIRDDRVDILVDTTLHTAGNRMLVFARKPAPVQLTMFGMPATTGLATLDARLTDPYLDPTDSCGAHYTEPSIRLPHCYWCYEPPEPILPVGELPARTGGFITFGCLNHLAKVSPPALRLWVKILQTVPDSRLVVQSEPGSHLQALYAHFQAGGIASDRITFEPKVPRLEYFQRYQRFDLALDPFPYNGHTSSLDALWMGVPVVTFAGGTAVGRGGASILSNLGLPDLIARTPAEYVDIGVRWASDRDRLAALRHDLRRRMESSPLMDVASFTAGVQAVFRRLWEQWCGG